MEVVLRGRYLIKLVNIGLRVSGQAIAKTVREYKYRRLIALRTTALFFVVV